MTPVMTTPTPRFDELKRRAREVAKHAYAPYSRFPVGAAVLCEDAIYSGANVENVSYGLCVCAERNAVVLYTPTPATATPCGACLQVIAEFGPDAVIVCCSDDENAERRYTLKELLPTAFSAPQLAKR